MIDLVFLYNITKFFYILSCFWLIVADLFGWLHPILFDSVRCFLDATLYKFCYYCCFLTLFDSIRSLVDATLYTFCLFWLENVLENIIVVFLTLFKFLFVWFKMVLFNLVFLTSCKYYSINSMEDFFAIIIIYIIVVFLRFFNL